MQYASYKRKILAVAKVLGFIRRYRALLITVGAMLSCGLAAFLALFGMVYDKTPCPDTVIYGDTLTYEAGAFLSDVDYEFSTDESFENFTESAPTLVGSYFVRARASSVFGTERYGRTHAFRIVKKTVTVGVLEDTLVYGNTPTASAQLLQGHKLSCSVFDYSDLTKDSVTVRARASAIRVKDADGNDVTNQYSFITPDEAISFTKRPITVTVESKQAYYNGMPLQFGGFAVTGGSLANFGDGRQDSAIATFSASIVNAGSLSYLPTTLKIITSDGLDVTSRYDITVVSGTLTVLPRPVVIEFNTTEPRKEFEYDGEKHSYTDIRVSPSTPLVHGHSYAIKSFTEIRDAGEVPNLISLSFTDGAGNPVDRNYYATFVPEGFTLRIRPRELTVRTESESWVYDGTAHSREEYSIVSGTLVSGHTHEGTRFARLTFAGAVSNTMTLTLRDALGYEVNNNYNIHFELGTLTVSRRSITVRTATRTWTYDAEVHKEHTFEVISQTKLAAGDEGIVTSGVSLTDYTPVSEDNRLTVDIRRGGTSVSSSYDITYVYGKVKIDRRPIFITTGSKEWTYDATTHSLPEWEYDAGSLRIVSTHLIDEIGYPTLVDASPSYTENAFTLRITDNLGKDKSENYSISYLYGKIRVNPRPLKIITNTNQWVYDGEAHSDEGFRYAQGSLSIVRGHEPKSENPASVTNVFDGVKQNTYVLKIYDGSVDKSANYTVSYTYGTLKITPRPVSIITGTNSWEYDGNRHSENSFTYNQGSLPFVAGYELNRIGLPSVRVVEDGVKTNNYSITVTKGGRDYTANYTISYLYGTIQIYAREITVLTDTNSWVFDGLSHKDEGFTVTQGSLVAGDTARAVGAPSVTYVTEGIVSNAFTVTITSSQGVSMDNNYRITYIYGNIQITPRILNVITDTNRWVYDGEAHRDNDWSYAQGSLEVIPTHSATATLSPEVDEVKDGVVSNRFAITVSDGSGANMTPNYDIRYTYGTLEITPRRVDIVTSTKSWEYDGKAHSDNTWEYAQGSLRFLNSHIVVASQGPSVTEVTEGSVSNRFELFVMNARGADMRTNYDIRYTYGTLKITPRAVTVRTDTSSWIYDGTSHRDDGWEVVSALGFLPEHTVIHTSSPLVRDVSEGLVENKFTLSVTYLGRYMDENYKITYLYGKVSITPRPITVETHSKEWDYDGEWHSEEGYHISDSSPYRLVGGETMSVLTATKIRDVKDNAPNNNALTFSILRDGAENISNYDITLIKGTVKIIPLDVIFKTEDDTFKYDGEYHYNYEYDYDASTPDRVLAGETHSVVSYTKVREVRETGTVGVDNLITVRVMRGTEDISDNYDITVNAGKLIITPRILYIETPDGEYVYDSKAHFDTEWKYAPDSPDRIVDGEEDRVDIYTKVTNVKEGKVTNELVLDIYRDGSKYSDNYDITYTKEGILEVTPRPVSIKTDFGKWVYDGKEHKKESFTYSEGSLKFVDGQTVTYIDAPSVKEVKDGIVDNIFTVSLFGKDAELDKNYDITYESYGTLEITHRRISVTTGTSEWYYDGLTHSDKTFTYNISTEYPDRIADGQSADISGYPEVRFVKDGTKTNDFVITVRDALGEDVSDNYIIDYKEYGTVKIKKSPITFEAQDGKWEFDGVEHTKPEYKITSERGLGEGDSATVNIVGAITEIGTEDNIIAKVTMRSYDGFDTTENYDITLIKGTLEVVKRKITLTADDATKVYDGTPLTKDSYRVTAGTVPGTHSITEIDIIGTITDAGSVPNVIDESSIVIMLGSRDVTDCYEITLIDGTLTVTKRKLTLTAGSAEKRWDGTPLKCPDYSISGDGVAPGQTLECETLGERTEVGIEKNIINKAELKITDATSRDVIKNYEITYIDGTLNVRPIATVLVITESAEKKYDGTPLTCPEYRYTVIDGTLPAGTEVNVTVTGTRTEVGISDNTFIIEIIIDGNDVTRHCDIRDALGRLEVLAREDKDKYFGGELDGSGEINSGLIEEGSDNYIAMHLRSEYTGKILLRYKSFGAFSGRKFLEAQEYGELIYGRFSFNYLTGIAMRNKGAMAYKLIAQPYSTSFALPYYMTPEEEGYDIQDSDVIYENSVLGNYSASHFVYDGLAGELVGYLGELSEAELLYREFVHSNYLDIDTETREFLDTVIAGAGLSSSDARIIERVRDYIRASASFNANYNTGLDSAENVVTAFLGTYKEGTSQHFAAAATMLYRALNIPARYTIGYLAEVKAGEWCELKASSSYAWVEVYIDGVGWIAVDVADMGENIGGESDITRDELLSKYPDISLDLTVRPVSVDKEYDGGPLFAKNELYADGYNALSKLLKLGFTYEVMVVGNRTEIGTDESIIASMTLYDPDGNDVTSLFNITTLKGKIRVTRTQIKVLLHEISKIYDGKEISYAPDGYTVIDIPEGYTLEFILAGARTEVGVLDIEELYALPYRVLNEAGEDVTDSYFLKFEGVGITVDYRPITLTAGSEIREYDGTPLTNDEVTVTFGELCEGDTLIADTVGSITDVGTVENHVDTDSVRIVNSVGKDVTENYLVTAISGKLTVTEP